MGAVLGAGRVVMEGLGEAKAEAGEGEREEVPPLQDNWWHCVRKHS